jgi:hypothetical protein
MRRLSIRTMMAVIAISSVGLAVLTNTNELWALMMLLTNVAMLGIATLGMIFLRAKEGLGGPVLPHLLEAILRARRCRG